MNNGVPNLSPEERRATYVVWLLGISPPEVFPLGNECSPEMEGFLQDWAYVEVRRLLDELQRAQVQAHERGPDFDRYLRTLHHVHDVIEGRADPADNGWHLNKKNYRRGRWVFHNLRPHKSGEAPA